MAGIGAVATQSQINISYGPLGLEFLQAGYTSEQALAALTTADPLADVRQAAIVDATGKVAAHTGSKCIPAAGHMIGEGFSCQANLMERDTVWAAMADAFTSADAPLAERMMAALDAAEVEGGDIRGKQSAAMLVVAGNPTGRSWEDRVIDLRVEDSVEPLVELRRLLRIKRAYMADSEADRLSESGDSASAQAKRMEATNIAPEMVELRFGAGVSLAAAGELEAGCKLIREAIRQEGDRWIETLHRLVVAERVTPEVAAAIEARLAATPRAV